MARGWESKSVEAQQEDRDRREPASSATPADPARVAQRRTLELARARAQADLTGARHPAHRDMLQAASTSIGVSSRRATRYGLMKMPDPMIPPMTTIVASKGPSARRNATREYYTGELT